LIPKGKIINEKLEPKIKKETLLKMYKTMKLGRVADIKALQFQRQGRMLTYAPNKGQEAAQVGSMAALEPKDWLSPSFRELNAMLYRDVELKQLYLYWYGNEWGNHFPEEARVLPVNVIIGSQINHAAGIAYASKILKKEEVALAMVGDGGTSHGNFYEGLNFASSHMMHHLLLLFKTISMQYQHLVKKQPKHKHLLKKLLLLEFLAFK
jgi:pyruvate dehydrogenase E1 component alpha subunit